MDEILQILPQAWTGEPFTHEGDVYAFPTRGVRPRPSQPIPVLIGGGAEVAIRRAARLADGLFSNAPVDQFVQQITWVLDECEQTGRDPATFRFVHYSVLLPAASREDALARYGDALHAMQWKYSDMEASSSRPLPPPAPPSRDGDPASGRVRTLVAGTPDQLVEAMHETRRRAGVAVEFVARSYFSLLVIDEQLAIMQQLAEDVAPHV